MNNDELLEQVWRAADSVPRAQRSLFAVAITAESGVTLVRRGELAAQLREQGLVEQAREALSRARGRSDVMLCWFSVGASPEDAMVGYRALPMRAGGGQ